MNGLDLFPETARVARELHEMFRCLKCKTLPSEPYFTGVCDHLLCINCLSKSNTCPICSAQFYKKESHLNRMVKEAILYVSEIIKLTSDGSDSSETSHNEEIILPKVNLNINTKEDSPKRDLVEMFGSDDSLPDISVVDIDKENKKDDSVFLKPLAPPVPIMQPPKGVKPLKNRTNQSESKETKPKRVSKTTSKMRSQSVNITVDKFEESQQQQQMTSTAIPRSQSMKRVKKNNKGETPIHLAVMKDDLESLRDLLKDVTIDVNVKDNAGWTALHEACNRGNLEIVKLLIEHNADLNSLGYQKNTPLHEAVINQNYDCVKYLIEKNADQTIRNEYGILARDIAKNNKDNNYLELFSENIQSEIVPGASQHADNSNDFELSSQSQIDLNASCATGNRRGNKKNVVKKVVIFGTGMNEEDKIKMSKLASKLKIQVAKELKNNVTHIIFTTGSHCTRTISYMKGVLMGIWIVSIKWLEDSAEKGVLEQENNYEAEGSIKIPTSRGPFKGRFNASCQYPKLFEDCYFFLSGEFKVFEKQDFVKLLELGGANILKREPKLERLDELVKDELPHHLYSKTDEDFVCSHFILYDVSKVKEIRHKYLNTVRPSWLFSSIDEFKILKP